MNVSTAPRAHHQAAPQECRPCLRDELSAEHKALAQALQLLDSVADEVDSVPHGTLRKDVDRVYGLVTQRVLPHARAEHDLRTRLAVHDHQRVGVEEDRLEIGRLARRLARLRSQLARGDASHAPRQIRHVLYELHALTRLHFADELVGSPADREGR